MEDIIFLDSIELKTENLLFKPFMDDKSVLQYWCYYMFMYFHAPHKVDGGVGFSFKYRLRNQMATHLQGVKCLLMTGLKGRTDFSVPCGDPRQSLGKHLGMRENKTHCFPWGHSLTQK